MQWASGHFQEKQTVMPMLSLSHVSRLERPAAYALSAWPKAAEQEYLQEAWRGDLASAAAERFWHRSERRYSGIASGENCRAYRPADNCGQASLVEYIAGGLSKSDDDSAGMCLYRAFVDKRSFSLRLSHAQ
jgi:hypothetical protein